MALKLLSMQSFLTDKKLNHKRNKRKQKQLLLTLFLLCGEKNRAFTEHITTTLTTKINHKRNKRKQKDLLLPLFLLW